MGTNRILICSWAVGAAITVSTQQACSRRATINSLVETVFAGYTYVGPDEIADPNSPQPLPPAFRPNVRYLFLLRRSSADVGQWNTIKQRLEIAGARVVDAPRSAGDLVHISVGGPLFRIEFYYAGHRGTIANEMAPRIRSSQSLSRDWLLERYVLEFGD